MTNNTLDKEIDEIFDWKFFDKNYPLSKQFYDIKTFDGDIRENCWPNAGDFHDGSARDQISEREVEFIRPHAKEKIASLIADREKKMLEFVIPKKKSDIDGYHEDHTPEQLNRITAMNRYYNQAIDEVRQRAKEWSKKNG